MTQYYYVGSDNQSHGPITPNQFLAHGLTANTLICPVGGGNWIALSTQPELMAYLQPGYSDSGSMYEEDRYAEQRVDVGSRPSNYLAWSILTTLFCCLPAGIVAIVYSGKVNGLWSAGRYASARKAASNAKKWCIISAVAGVFLALLLQLTQ